MSTIDKLDQILDGSTGNQILLPKYKKIIEYLYEHNGIGTYTDLGCYTEDSVWKSEVDLGMIADVLISADEIERDDNGRVKKESFLDFCDDYPGFTAREYCILTGESRCRIDYFKVYRKELDLKSDMPKYNGSFYSFIALSQIMCLLRDNMLNSGYSRNKALKEIHDSHNVDYYDDELIGDADKVKWIIGDEYYDMITEGINDGTILQYPTGYKFSVAINVPSNATKLYVKSLAQSFSKLQDKISKERRNTIRL